VDTEPFLRPDLTDAEFDRAMTDLLRHQARANPVYARFLSALGTDPDRAATPLDFPALPVSAFRRDTVACFDPARTTTVFETSGTTSETPGKHLFPSTRIYETALLAGFRLALPDVSCHRWLSLIPPAEQRPRSSLSHMVSHLARVHRAEVLWLAADPAAPDFEGLDRALAEATDRPVFLLGTSGAWLRWLGRNRSPHPLPAGSVVFDTGGFKKEPAAPTPGDLWKQLADTLRIPAGSVVNEYGMTELSSQAYTTGDSGLHRTPPWLRLVVIDPRTGQQAAEGEPGLVHAYDLANVHSVAAVATLDVAVQEPGGLRLRGRLAGAPARGCSLPYEVAA
jgi:hypothetical protein